MITANLQKVTWKHKPPTEVAIAFDSNQIKSVANANPTADLDIRYSLSDDIAPVEIDGYSRQNNIIIDSNAVASVFGKDNAVTKLLYNAVTDEANGKTALYYWNKKVAESLLRKAGLQLPRVPLQDGYIHSISDSGSTVNKKLTKQTETQQFKRWFGKSKVVNADGTPKIVYHGSPSDFTVFDLKQSGKNYPGVSDGFFFFTNKKSAYPNSAKNYAGENGNIYSVYLSIKKPLRLDSKGYYDNVAYFDQNSEQIYDKFFNGDYEGVIIENSNKSMDDITMFHQ